MRQVPDQIVHYSRGEPFRSIMSVPLEELQAVVSNLNESNAWGLNRFKDLKYYNQRREVERSMRAKFIEMGGEPTLSHPIYFFLGRHARFEEHPLNVGYSIELSQLSKKHVSFSYGDTMLSFNDENRKLAGEKYESPLCSELFLIDDLKGVLESKLFPVDSPLAIEAHLWVQPSGEVVRCI